MSVSVSRFNRITREMAKLVFADIFMRPISAYFRKVFRYRLLACCNMKVVANTNIAFESKRSQKLKMI
ncbi:hypothetical protein D3C76_1331790 [compost metagenome]